MFKKIIVNLVLITAVSTMTSTTTVFADNSSTEITKSTSLNEDSTFESTNEASSTTETTLASQEQPVESSQSNQENQISSSPMYNSEEELRKQFETDSRNEVLSFEEYKTLIDTLGSLPASQDPAPEARSLFKAGNQRDQIVTEAKKHLGKSYTQSYPDRLGPNKFDCSGLTRYVFLQVTGKNIGDWTVPQEKSGTKINISKANISQLEAGDLLFWGTAGATYHVAIYIGNGQYIHAPNYDRKVEQSQIWWTEFPPSFALKMNFTDSKPQGNPINDGSYVTITQKGYNLYSSFNWTKKNASDELFNNTYQAKVRYTHSNGDTYYSLYDSKGIWQGYINSKAVKKGAGKQGIWLKNDEFVTVIKNNAPIWSNINNFTYKQGVGNKLYQKTYHAQGRYSHFSGETFYSLFNDKGVWQGYINQKNVTKAAGKQGAWLKNDEFVTVTKNNAPIWSNINNFTYKQGVGNKLYQKTYHAQGRYSHFSGETFYSLFNDKGVWQGYINQKNVTKAAGKQGAWMRNDEHVTITKKNYTIWGNINDFSYKKGNTNTVYQKSYHAQGRYHHFSGEVYYSLFDNNNKWIGYINKTGVTIKR